MRTTITVPPTTAEQAKAGSWRKTVTALTNAKGGQAVEGEWLTAGDTITLPTGTIVIAVDKVTTGWDTHYRTGQTIPVQTATVTLHLAAADGLQPQWTKQFKSAASALGATTRKRIAALLAEHSPTGGEVAVTQEAQRPNHRTEPCRWCRVNVPSGLGHIVGRGQDAEVEHWQKCPPRLVISGTPCTLCGVTVVAGSLAAPAEQVLVRDGSGRWETRHAARVDCTAQPVESWEDQQYRIASARAAEDAARAAARDQQVKREAAAKARRGQREAQARVAHDAEQARVDGLEETGRTERTLFDKGLSPTGERAQIAEVTVGLSDGTTTLRWAVRTYHRGSGWTGEDYDPEEGTDTEYTSLSDARAAYQQLQYTAPVRERSTGGAECAECGRTGARFDRHDSSGIPGKVCASCDRCRDYELSFA